MQHNWQSSLPRPRARVWSDHLNRAEAAQLERREVREARPELRVDAQASTRKRLPARPRLSLRPESTSTASSPTASQPAADARAPVRRRLTWGRSSPAALALTVPSPPALPPAVAPPRRELATYERARSLSLVSPTRSSRQHARSRCFAGRPPRAH